MTLEDQIRALLEAKQNKDKDQDKADQDDQQQADRVDDEPAVKIENPMDPNLTSSEISPQEEIANAEMQGQANKQNVQEYFVRGTVNGKKFQSVTDDAYSADQIKAQNPHLTDDEAKAVQNHTESDEFTNGDEYTSSNQNGHKVIVHTNGGYQGDVTHTLNKIGVDESISDLLGDEFSEEFKVKAQTIFEAAVKDQVMKFEAKLQEEQNAAAAKLQEEFDEKFEQMKKHLEEETSDKIDGYLSHLAEEWKKDNEIALEAAIKSELTESFINNLKTVFEQHYIDLPEDKVDLYQKTLEEKAEMENALATMLAI